MVVHRLSYSRACEIFPYQGLNPWLLHWQSDSLRLGHQGSPKNLLKKLESVSEKSKSIKDDKSIMDLANDKNNPNNYIFKEFIENSRTNDYDKPNPDVCAIYVLEAP